MKRTFILSILAAVSAALLPLATLGQIAQPKRTRPSDEERTFKYEVYAGYAYTSLNQVNQSRYGLQGVNVSVTRNWGRYFGVTAEGDYFSLPIANPVVNGSNVKPTVSSFFVGPVIHAALYGRFSAFAHGLLGGEHTGGESQTPNISFAGGPGGGLEYKLRPQLSVRASGDVIGASFSLAGNTAELGYSPHRTWDSRASLGVVYKF